MRTSNHRLREHFLGWQCRLRQLAVRQQGGRPSPGMCPRVVDSRENEILPAMTTVLVETEPEESVSQFRFIVAKTPDPKRRYEEALQILAAAHYQHPENFSAALTSVFAIDSPPAARLLEAGACVLLFEQFGQRYRLPCVVFDLDPDDDAYQATYWHNKLFNPALPARVRILQFEPDWARVSATPAPETD